ncbi:MAG: helix-turn-helix transcriptional regulator [Armatimonadetes bacterium]|nr:helix-turn-helix transcriptional regulator [Armatimonadota bacterium]
MSADRDAILWRFVRECDGSPASVREWVGRYPDYADDLVAVSVYGALVDDVTPAQSAMSQEADALASDMLSALVAARGPRPRGIRSIVDVARGLGITPAALAARLGVGLTILGKLERRLLAPDSVPRALLARLAEAVGVGIEDVGAYLRRAPTLSPSASYRAAHAPRLAVAEESERYSMSALSYCMDMRPDEQVPSEAPRRRARRGGDEAVRSEPVADVRESFADAIRSASDMTEREKADWLQRDPGVLPPSRPTYGPGPADT